MESKVCKKCGIEKPLDQYWKKKTNTDGRMGSCNTCACKKQNEWVNNNRELRRKRVLSSERRNVVKKGETPWTCVAYGVWEIPEEVLISDCSASFAPAFLSDDPRVYKGKVRVGRRTVLDVTVRTQRAVRREINKCVRENNLLR